MRKSKFAEEQIELALRQTMAGNPSGELCLKLGITEATFYRWRRRLGGLGVPEPRKRRQLREANRSLTKVVADLSLDQKIFEERSGEKW